MPENFLLILISSDGFSSAIDCRRLYRDGHQYLSAISYLQRQLTDELRHLTH